MSPEVPWSLCLMSVCCQLLGKSMSRSLSFGSGAARLRMTFDGCIGWGALQSLNSHFHCAPAMGQLQHILGHTFCWGFSFFLPSCGPGLGEPGSGQQPRCSGEGPHNLNLYSSVSAQGGDAAGSATLHPRCWMRAHSLHAREGPAWALPAELRCLPLGGSAGTRAERGVWCSSMLSLV